MKGILLITLMLSAFEISVRGQGYFEYDQQSADETTGGGSSTGIQAFQPIGQTFTPTLPSVGFIRLAVSDAAFDGIGATLFVNLRSDSINGIILGATDSVELQDGFVGFVNFIFHTPISVTPGDTYLFQPVAQGGGWSVRSYDYNYSGGTVIIQGSPVSGFDLWFREGIIVPEPSAVALIVIGGGGLLWLGQRKRNRG